MARIGILGGSFNPVHVGHLRLAVEVREYLGLDRVEFVPASIPPHKGEIDLLPFEFRCELVETVLRNREGLVLNTMEGEREGPSYTVDTLKQLLAAFPDDEFFFLLGTTDLQALPTWYAWREIFSLAQLAAVDRGGATREETEGFLVSHFPGYRRVSDSEYEIPGGKSLWYIPVPRLDISSTMVRNRIRRDRSIAFLVPSVIEGLLLSHGKELLLQTIRSETGNS